jgi:hypothetical protein
MKSAYELAMERLAKSEPEQRPLSEEKKRRLAEIDRFYTGRIAEREIFLRQQFEKQVAAGDADEAGKIRDQISSERGRLEEERDAEKDRVRSN